MPYTHIFLDLDGTVTDSCPGILNSVRHALEYFQISLPQEELLSFIGPPLRDSFAPLLHDTARVSKAIEKYREYYTETGIFENSVYAGVREMLDVGCQAGLRFCLATSKPEPFALRILEHYGLTEYFVFVAGAELQGPRQHKPQVLRHACTQLGLHELSGCLMAGDRKYDVEGAHAVGMACAGVLYGYGTLAELQKAGADYICPTVQDLQERILS